MTAQSQDVATTLSKRRMNGRTTIHQRRKNVRSTEEERYINERITTHQRNTGEPTLKELTTQLIRCMIKSSAKLAENCKI